MEVDVPAINLIIPDEVCTYNSAYDSVILTIQGSDPMDLDAASETVSKNKFEPARCLDDTAPPKRFYRTFWRSVAIRILALSNIQTMHDEKLETRN